MRVRDGLASFCREDNVSSAMILVDKRAFFFFRLVLFSACDRFSEIIMLLLCKNNSIFVQIA